MIRRALATLRSPLRVGVVAILVLAFALLFLNLSLAQQQSPSSQAADVATPTAPVATVTTTFLPAATATIPLTGSTPTPEIRDRGPPQTKTTGTAPLRVIAVAAEFRSDYTVPRAPELCYDNTMNTNAPLIAVANPIQGSVSLHFAPASAEGDVVFRWRLSTGWTTPPETLTWRSPTFNTSIPAAAQATSIVFQAAEADGTQMWAQVEILSPTPMLSDRVYFYAPNCAFRFLGFGSQLTDLAKSYYDCTGSDAQTFSATGRIIVSPSQGGSVTYHWERSDGTSSAPTTVMALPNAHDVPPVADTFTVTRATPAPTNTSPISSS